VAGTLTAARLRALLLVAPLAAFIGITFLAPLAAMLVRSVHDPLVADALPATLALLRSWDGNGAPPEAVFAAAARELVAAREQRTLGRVATRVNRVQAGLRSVFTRSVRRLRGAETDSWSTTMVAADAAWGEAATWRALQRAGERWTLRHYLNAIDRDRAPDGRIVRQPEERRIYLRLFGRTLLVSFTVTGLCLLLGYPLAYLIAHAPPRRAALLLVGVLLPFWTSLLVRTTAWIVLLQTQGVINDLLVGLGVIGDQQRLAMVYNMTGTLIAMTHVLLPFMVLPLYSVMRTIRPEYVRAAASLGAGPVQAFFRVYWPQSLPGVGAGTLLVFIVALGYYITPALVGGRTGQLISNLIAYHMQESLNWGLAAALGAILLLGVLMFYVVYDRVVGINRLRLG
jgi:putative spermidine/putrescine transport system permease protein